MSIADHAPRLADRADKRMWFERIPTRWWVVGAILLLLPLVANNFWLFQIMGVLGVIFGSVGLKQTRNGARGGRGMAMAGVVIGIVLVLLCVVFWIYFANNANCVRNGNRFDCTTK